MIKAVIFDWHGVIDRITLKSFTDVIVNDSNIPEKELLDFIAPIEDKVVVGKMNHDEYVKSLQDKFGLDLNIINEAFDKVDGLDVNEEVWHYILEIKDKYKIAIISDCHAEKATMIRKFIKLDHFDTVLLSSEIKLSKRSNEIFLHCSNKLNLNPSECLFVDDMKELVNRASKLGFKTCLFSTLDDLKRSLSEN